MYAIMESEKSEDALRWVLMRLVDFCPEASGVIQTVFSDKGLPEHLVTDVLGPTVKSLLCVFHMGLNLNHRLGKLGTFIQVFLLLRRHWLPR